jgi:hypothetical protein
MLLPSALPHPHMECGRQMAFVNHFYFYLWDPEWGGAFWKTCAYALWPIWIWLKGHTWAQRQCTRAGVGYSALDNGFRTCDNPDRLQQICDRLGPGAVKSFFWRWQRLLPSPLSQDAGIPGTARSSTSAVAPRSDPSTRATSPWPAWPKARPPPSPACYRGSY